MKTFIKTLLVAVTVLFSLNVAAKTVKLPAGIKYVNSTDEFYCTEIDGLYCQTKNLFEYKGNRYVFVVEQGGAWCYDSPMSVLNLESTENRIQRQPIVFRRKQTVLQNQKWCADCRCYRHLWNTNRCSSGQT